jgi:predicted TIM-barrel fold metal-dependent hydrolase
LRPGRASRRDVLRAATGLSLLGLAAGPASGIARAQAPQPATAPAFALPPGACDCHVHVIGDPSRYAMVPTRRYTPPQASVEALLALQSALHLERVVVVQPSFYGTDNRCTVDALQALGARARGIAVIDEYATDAQLDALQKSGVRGVRVNLETAGETDSAAAFDKLFAAAARVSGRDWHVQCYTRLSIVAALKDEIGALPVPVVLDHFAGAKAEGGEPGWSALLALVRSGNVYVKLSAPYRISSQPGYGDVAPLARALVETRADRMLWGSDWPHTSSARPPGSGVETISPFTPIDDGAVLNLFASWVPDPATRRQILVDNPARLYGF